MANNKKQFALLIDGDNAQASLLPQIMKEINKYGSIVISRIFGDWTSTRMNSWKSDLNVYSITPIQQFSYTTGKNATDSALIIDAMDILHTKDINAFCIVSSDSDYTKLATRIRENNLFVLGIGREDASKSFVNACDKFIFTDTLSPKKKAKAKAKSTPAQSKKVKPPVQNGIVVSDKNKKKMVRLFKKAFELIEGKDWITLSELGKALHTDPKFDPKIYGNKQLLKLVRLYPKSVELRNSGSKSKPVYHVRLKAK